MCGEISMVDDANTWHDIHIENNKKWGKSLVK